MRKSQTHCNKLLKRMMRGERVSARDYPPGFAIRSRMTDLGKRGIDIERAPMKNTQLREYWIDPKKIKAYRRAAEIIEENS